MSHPIQVSKPKLLSCGDQITYLYIHIETRLTLQLQLYCPRLLLYSQDLDQRAWNLSTFIKRCIIDNAHHKSSFRCSFPLNLKLRVGYERIAFTLTSTMATYDVDTARARIHRTSPLRHPAPTRGPRVTRCGWCAPRRRTRSPNFALVAQTNAEGAHRACMALDAASSQSPAANGGVPRTPPPQARAHLCAMQRAARPIRAPALFAYASGECLRSAHPTSPTRGQLCAAQRAAAGYGSCVPAHRCIFVALACTHISRTLGLWAAPAHASQETASCAPRKFDPDMAPARVHRCSGMRGGDKERKREREGESLRT
ncbi:hypothetical protein DFH06DRAFT_1329086 [Mycena polygramma]|nr:hypothetical protein DFH06DRAFT_1329086 [Mycena polygramma]